MADPGQFVSYTIRPNLRALGRGSASGSTRSATPWSRLTRVRSRSERELGAISMSTQGEGVALAPSDILIDTVRLPWLRGGAGRALDGGPRRRCRQRLSRKVCSWDFVRGIQDARKQAGYPDRRHHRNQVCRGSGGRACHRGHREYVMTETLATTLQGDTAHLEILTPLSRN